MPTFKTTNHSLREPRYRYSGIDKLPGTSLETNIQQVDISKFSADSEIPQIAWLGHSSFVIVWRNQTLLLDPVFARTIGIVPRRLPVPKAILEVGPQAILVSHAHMDHLNNPSLSLFPDAPIYLPNKTEQFLSPTNLRRSHPVQLRKSFNLGSLTIMPVEALHGGWRYPWQQGYIALGYVISDGKYRVYYAGDSAYGDHFAEIGNESPIDIALLPIGAYSPRWFLKDKHLNPPEAVEAAKDLQARSVTPYHFGTYRLALDPLEEALPWFEQEAAQSGIKWSLPIGLS